MFVISSKRKHTPLAGKDVINSIGFGATTSTLDKILEETADLNAITDDPTSKNLFEIFKTLKPELQIMITEEKIMDKYKKWNKHTTTSLSGSHLSHYHALF